MSEITIHDRFAKIIAELQDAGITATQAISAFERQYVAAALSKSRGNVSQAARSLGWHRNTIITKRKKYEISKHEIW